MVVDDEFRFTNSGNGKFTSVVRLCCGLGDGASASVRLLDGKIASTERGNSAAFVGAGPDPDDGHVIHARGRGASACGRWVSGRAAGTASGFQYSAFQFHRRFVAVSFPLPRSYILLAHSLARSFRPPVG